MAKQESQAGSGYHHGNLRSAMLEATRQIVQQEGLGALTLRKASAIAGVSAPAAYHHFPSKTHLIAAAAGVAFEQLDQQLAEAERLGDSASARLEELAVAYVRFALREPGHFQLIFGAHVRSLDLAAHECVRLPGRRARQRLKDAVGSALDERRLGLDRTDAVAIFWGQLVGLASLVTQRELGAGLSLARTEALVRTSVRSHLRLLED